MYDYLGRSLKLSSWSATRSSAKPGRSVRGGRGGGTRPAITTAATVMGTAVVIVVITSVWPPIPVLATIARISSKQIAAQGAQTEARKEAGPPAAVSALSTGRPTATTVVIRGRRRTVPSRRRRTIIWGITPSSSPSAGAPISASGSGITRPKHQIENVQDEKNGQNIDNIFEFEQRTPGGERKIPAKWLPFGTRRTEVQFVTQPARAGQNVRIVGVIIAFASDFDFSELVVLAQFSFTLPLNVSSIPSSIIALNHFR